MYTRSAKLDNGTETNVNSSPERKEEQFKDNDFVKSSGGTRKDKITPKGDCFKFVALLVYTYILDPVRSLSSFALPFLF